MSNATQRPQHRYAASRIHARLILAFAACLAVSLPARATLVPRMSLEQMAAAADTVIHGTVVRTWAAWDSTHDFIWTHYEIRLTESMLGDTLDKVVISEPGGAVGGDSMDIVGTPRYRIAEEVVLFTTRTPIGYLRTSGWGQGRFDVVADPRTGSKMVRSRLAGVELVEPAGAVNALTQTPGTSPKVLDGLPLDQFKSRIKTLISNRQRPRGER
jgi:hypothetical protein